MNGPAPQTDESADSRLREMAAEVSRLRDFAELSSDWFWEQDAEFRFTRFFGSSPEKLRRRQSDFIGKRRWDMPISGVTPAQLAEHIVTCERHEPFRDFVYEIPSAEGLPQYYAISGTPVFDSNGKFTGYHGVGRNITDLRRAQQTVAESERRLSQIVDGSPVSIFVIDSDHRVSHWNQACESLTGVTAKAIVGTRDAWRGFYASPRPTMADLVVGDAPELKIALHYADKYSRSRLIHGGFEAEDYFPQMQGGGRWLFFTAAPLYDSAGNISGAIETLQDVTSRKATERAEREHWEQLQVAHTELQQAVRQLVEAEKLASLGRLVAGVSHELNTPLGNAMMMASSLSETIDELIGKVTGGSIRRSDLDRLLSVGRDSGALLVASIARATRLVNRFREIVAEPGGDSAQVFRLRSLVTGIVACMEERLAKRNIEIRIEISESVSIESYPAALEQILVNLLENSLVHGFAARARGVIRIAAEMSDDQLAIEYSDDGCGMTDEVRRHAFDPFFTTTLGQGESGLGLYLAHNLAAGVLGGRIELVGPAGTEAGSQFRILLPGRQ